MLDGFEDISCKCTKTKKNDLQQLLDGFEDTLQQPQKVPPKQHVEPEIKLLEEQNESPSLQVAQDLALREVRKEDPILSKKTQITRVGKQELFQERRNGESLKPAKWYSSVQLQVKLPRKAFEGPKASKWGRSDPFLGFRAH